MIYFYFHLEGGLIDIKQASSCISATEIEQLELPYKHEEGCCGQIRSTTRERGLITLKLTYPGTCRQGNIGTYNTPALRLYKKVSKKGFLYRVWPF